jgi:calcium-dependent protein kinase
LTLNVNIAERSEPVRSVEPISSNTIKLLKQYGDATKFKKEALRILLNQLKESEIRQLTRKFEDLDRDKNGMITVQELQGVMG